MNNGIPQKDETPAPGSSYSGIPLNPPSAVPSAIPVNVVGSPSSGMPAPPVPQSYGQPVNGQYPNTAPGFGAPAPQAGPYPSLNGKPAPSAPYGTPLNAPAQGTPLAYPPQPAGQNPYAPPPDAPNPYAQQLPPGYQVPNNPYSNAPNNNVPNNPYGAPQNSPYGTQQNAAYRPLSSEAISDGPNIGMGVFAGIVVMIVCGLVFGFGSIAIGFRIPFLSIGIGYAVGYAVLKASKENGDMQGIVAGVCSLLACLMGLGIMYLGNAYFSPIAFLLVAYATYRAYVIAANG